MRMQSLNGVIASEKLKVKSVAERVVSNFAWSVLSESTGKGLFFVATLYLARTLGVENFGLFTLAQTFTFYFWGAVDLGTNMYGIRELAKNKGSVEDIINPLLTLRITVGFAVFLLYVLSLSLFDMPEVKRLAFAGCGLYLLTYAFYPDWIFKGLEKFRYISLGSLASSVFFLLATLSFVKGSQNLIIATFVWSASYLLGSTVLFYCLLRKLGVRFRPDFNFKSWRIHLSESIFFQISGTLIMLTQYVPVVLLGLFFNDYTVGLFSAPYRIVVFVCHSGFLIMMSVYPVLSDLHHRDNSRFIKTQLNFLKLMLPAGLAFAVIGTAFGDFIVKTALGEQYLQASGVFKLIVWLIPIYFIRYVYGTSLQITGKQRLHTVSSFAGLIVMITVGVLLTFYLGLSGAAATILLSESTCLAMILYFSKSELRA